MRQKNRTKYIAELISTVETLVSGKATSSRNQAAPGSNSAELIDEVCVLTKKSSDLTKLNDGNSHIQQSKRLTELVLRNVQCKSANLLAESS